MNKFDEVLKNNREKRSRALEMQRKRIKKEKRVNNILLFTVATYIVVSTLLNIALICK